MVQHDLHLTRPPQARQDAPLPVLYLSVPQERRSFLRRNGVDIEAGAPLEAGDLSELGHDLDVPVVELAGPLVQRRGVQDEVERRRAQSPVQPAQRVREEPRKRSEEHTSELQSRLHLVCRLLLEKKKIRGFITT